MNYKKLKTELNNLNKIKTISSVNTKNSALVIIESVIYRNKEYTDMYILQLKIIENINKILRKK